MWLLGPFNWLRSLSERQQLGAALILTEKLWRGAGSIISLQTHSTKLGSGATVETISMHSAPQLAYELADQLAGALKAYGDGSP